MIVTLLSTSDWLSHTSVKKPTFNRSSYHLLQYKKKLYLECFKRKHTKQQSTKKKKKLLQTNMKQHWILSVQLVFHISNKVNPATTALAIINTTYFGAWPTPKVLILEDVNKKSEEWVQQPHPQWGHFNPWLRWGKRTSCSQYNTWQVGTGYNREREWWALVILG